MPNDLYLGCGYQSEQGHGYAAFCLYDFKIYYYEFVYIIYFGFLEGMYDMKNPKNRSMTVNKNLNRKIESVLRDEYHENARQMP